LTINYTGQKKDAWKRVTHIIATMSRLLPDRKFTALIAPQKKDAKKDEIGPDGHTID
jgi:hypothetical protein